MKITNQWFYSDPPKLFRLLLIYIKGDILVLLPLCIGIALLGLADMYLMLLGLGVYMTFRYLGEMMYWLLQQFGPKKYRPYDYGLKNLDNNAIYILYQLTSLCWAVVGALVVLYILFF